MSNDNTNNTNNINNIINIINIITIIIIIIIIIVIGNSIILLYRHYRVFQPPQRAPVTATPCDVLDDFQPRPFGQKQGIVRRSTSRQDPGTWLWGESWSGYGSIPIHTIFRMMNIHKSQLFWCELQGYKVLTHCHLSMRGCRSTCFCHFKSRSESETWGSTKRGRLSDLKSWDSSGPRGSILRVSHTNAIRMMFRYGNLDCLQHRWFVAIAASVENYTSFRTKYT